MSLRTLAQKGTAEEFRTAYSGPATGELLMQALINRDPGARAGISHVLLDDGVDASIIEYGQNALSVLIGTHAHVGPRDGELFARLVADGADVNFRERRGELIIHLVAKARADDEQMRAPMYAALFGAGDLDLTKPVNVHKPEPTMRDWLERFVARRPERHRILAEYLAEA